MAASQGKTGGMQDIILTRVNALVDEMNSAKGIAEANVAALVDNAARNDPGYAEVEKMRNAWVNAMDALRDKVRESVKVPTDQDIANAKAEVTEIRKKMRDLYGAIPTILEVSTDDLNLPEAFTNEVVKQKAKSGASGIRRPRIDSAVIKDSQDNAIRTWDSDVTITKIAEFLEIDNAVIMPHIPEDLKKHDKVEFHISPDEGSYKGKQLFFTLIPRK